MWFQSEAQFFVLAVADLFVAVFVVCEASVGCRLNVVMTDDDRFKTPSTQAQSKKLCDSPSSVLPI